MTYLDITTPALLLDSDIMEANIVRMKSKAKEHGVQLRTHFKTAKSLDIAKRLVSEENPGITVSTLREAEYFASGGYKDILYAVSIDPRKFERIGNLYQNGIGLKVILDDMVIARRLCDWTETTSCILDCLIEIDTDGDRAGITPDSEDLIALAQTLDGAKNVNFLGVMTHAGGSYHCLNLEQVKAHSELERVGCVYAAQRIRGAGIECRVVSIGSTPTIVASENFEGVTEVRPGVYVFYDLFQAGLGVCQMQDIALSVMTTVMGHNRNRKRLFLDAGALALSKDRSTGSQMQDFGYGLLCDIEGKPFEPKLRVGQVNQEHGIVDVEDLSLFDKLPIGTVVRVLPNHACMTAAAYDLYHVLQNNNYATKWPRCNGW